jgi:ABC-type uncharacterized transport system substrate-binding protein
MKATHPDAAKALKEFATGIINGQTDGTIWLPGPAGAKRLELLHELVPNATVFAMIVNPKSPNADVQLKDAQAAARALGQQIHVFNASTENEIDAAFALVAKQKSDALLVGTDPFFTSQRDRLVALAARNRNSGSVLATRLRSGRRADELRSQSYRRISSSRHLRWFSKVPNLPICQ